MTIGLVAGTDHVGQAALAPAADLHDGGARPPVVRRCRSTLPHAAMPPTQIMRVPSGSGQRVGGPGRASARGAHHHDLLVARDLVDSLGQLAGGDVDGARNGPFGDFVGLAHVEHERLVVGAESGGDLLRADLVVHR